MTLTPHYRWVALAAAVLFQASTWAFLGFCFAFWVAPWSKDFEVSITQIMLIMTSVMLVTGASSAIVGRFFDRYPANQLVTLGILMLASGLWLGSYSQTYAQIFAVYGVMLPLACSLTGTLASQAVAVKWFDGHSQMGLAIGIAAMGISLGGVVLPPLVESGVDSEGWRWVFRQTALALSVVLAPLMFFVLMPTPESVATKENFEQPTGEEAETLVSIPFRDLLKNKYFTIPIIAFFLDGVAYQGFSTNSKVYMTSIGIADGAGAIISTLATTMLIAKILMGKLTDWISYKALFIGAGLCNIVGLLIFASGNGELLTVGVLFLGLGAGGLIPLQAKIINHHFGADHFAQVFGFFLLLQMLGVVGSPLLSGLYEMFGSYSQPFIIMAGCVVIAILMMVTLKRDQ